jgi:heme exporter protein C
MSTRLSIDAPATRRPAASPAAFYRVAGRLVPWCWALALVCGLAGLVIGLVLAPTDLPQGELVRVVFVHVPAAWSSLAIGVAVAAAAALGVALNAPVASVLAAALAPTGALMAFLALWTGALWGKPLWGAWWVWDARLASQLLLLALALGFVALQALIAEPRRADRAAALLALAGVLQLPLIHWSQPWWAAVHESASEGVMRAPGVSGALGWGLALSTAAFAAWSAGAVLHRARSIVLERARGSDWALAPDGERA